MKAINPLLALVMCYSIAAAQPYDLKLNLNKGQQYAQSMKMNLEMSESIGGQEVNINTYIMFELKQTVQSITSASNYVIENEYTRVVINVDAMGQKMSYDSNIKDTSSNDAMKTYTEAFGEMLGRKFYVTLSPKGKVIEIKGLKEIIKALSDRTQDPAAIKLIEGTLDEKKMESNFESSYHIFPDTPVKIGDTWSQKSKVESIVPMEFTILYSLKEVSQGTAKIIASGDLTVKDDNFETNGMKMKINLNGSCDGSYMMDIATGISSVSSIAMPMKGIMEIMGMEVPVTLNTSLVSTTDPLHKIR